MKYLLLLAVALAGCGGTKMTKTGPLKACVFSQVDARMTLNGEPVVGARIIREWDWQTKNSDETRTDRDGRFSFPAIYERHPIRLLPAEFNTAQYLTVHYQGEEFAFWVANKREAEENVELGGIPLELNCELSDDLKLTHFDLASTVRTVCTWDKRE